MNKINKKAFTLIELLAVVVILGILLVIVVPSVTSTFSETKENAILFEVKQFLSTINNSILTKNEKYKKLDLVKDKYYVDTFDSSYEYSDGLLFINDNNVIENGMICLKKDEKEYFITYKSGNLKLMDTKYDYCELISLLKKVSINNLNFYTNDNRTSSEGLYLYEDNEHVALYLKNLNNNYVSFANNTWRIVKILEDKMQIVLDSNECEFVNQEQIVGKLNSWYNSLNLLEQDKIVKEQFYYESVKYDYLNDVGKYNIEFTLGDKFNENVGLITMQDMLKTSTIIYKNNNWSSELEKQHLGEFENMYLLTNVYDDINKLYYFSSDGYFTSDYSKKKLCPSVYINLNKYKLDGTGTKNDPFMIQNIS